MHRHSFGAMQCVLRASRVAAWAAALNGYVHTLSLKQAFELELTRMAWRGVAWRHGGNREGAAVVATARLPRQQASAMDAGPVN